MLIFSVALLYSLYIEIPFNQSYLGAGKNQLVTSGTYALCRHPGVLWYAFFAVGLVLASSHHWAIYAAPVWISMNILFAWIQDRYYFPQLFPGYSDYKTTTPFLIPTRLSIQHFQRSFNK